MIKTYNLTINVLIFLNLFIDFVHPFVKFLFLCIFLGSELFKKKKAEKNISSPDPETYQIGWLAKHRMPVYDVIVSK